MGLLIKVFLAFIGLMVAAAMAVALVFYFSPDLQRKLVLKGLQEGYGEEARLDYLRVSLDSFELRGLHISSEDESLDLEKVEARFDFWNLTGDVPEIETIVVTGFDLDIAAHGGTSLGAKYSTSKDANVGVDTPSHQQPGVEGVPIRIGRVAIDGRVKLPQEREVRLNFLLQDLAPDATASLDAQLFLANHDPGQAYQDADLRYVGSLHQTVAGMPDHGEGELIVRLRESPDGDWMETRAKTRFEGNTEQFSAAVTDLDLATLSRLSFCNLSRPLASGKLDLNLQGRTGSPNVVEGSLSITEIRPEGYAGDPWAVRIAPVARFNDADKTTQLDATITLTAPATETLATISANVDATDDDLLRFDATAQADVLDTDDWQPLLVLLPESEGPAPERDPSPDKEAPWSGLEGTVLVELQRLVTAGHVLTGLSVEATVENGESVSTTVRLQSNGTPITASGDIRFLADSPDVPYALRGGVQVKTLNVTPFLKPTDPRHPAMLEGVFNVDGEIASSAPNLSFLADNLTGKLDLTSAGAGIFRPLGENTSVAQGVSGLLGALTGSVRELNWIQMVVDQLEEIPYRQMTFKLSRDENLNFVLNEMDLVSRETRIRGNGIIRFQEDVDLLSLPMDLQFQIFAKGKLAEALASGKQLRSTQPDELGFLPGPPLPIRGSLGDPESLLVNLLMDSGAQLLPSLLKGNGRL